jgi:hypothetical protein
VYKPPPDILAGGPRRLTFCHATIGGSKNWHGICYDANRVPQKNWHDFIFEKKRFFLLKRLDIARR